MFPEVSTPVRRLPQARPALRALSYGLQQDALLLRPAWGDHRGRTPTRRIQILMRTGGRLNAGDAEPGRQHEIRVRQSECPGATTDPISRLTAIAAFYSAREQICPTAIPGRAVRTQSAQYQSHPWSGCPNCRDFSNEMDPPMEPGLTLFASIRPPKRIRKYRLGVLDQGLLIPIELINSALASVTNAARSS